MASEPRASPTVALIVSADAGAVEGGLVTRRAVLEGQLLQAVERDEHEVADGDQEGEHAGRGAARLTQLGVLMRSVGRLASRATAMASDSDAAGAAAGRDRHGRRCGCRRRRSTRRSAGSKPATTCWPISSLRAQPPNAPLGTCVCSRLPCSSTTTSMCRPPNCESTTLAGRQTLPALHCAARCHHDVIGAQAHDDRRRIAGNAQIADRPAHPRGSIPTRRGSAAGGWTCR